MVIAKNGNSGVCCSSSSIKCARICACIWFTSISGMFNPRAKDFAKEVPTNKEPIRPGPLVNAMADSCFLSIFALAKA